MVESTRLYACDEKTTVEQEKASIVCQPRPPKQHASSATPIDRDPGLWPVGGFADDDSAAAYVLDVMRKRGPQKVYTLTIEEVDLIHTTGQDKSLRPYQQVTRSERMGSLYKRSNFVLPHPVMGKVIYSKGGLTTIIQGLQTVVCKYKGGPVAKLPPLQQHVNRLVAAKGTMDYNRPFQKGQTYFVLCDPYTPEGVRSALAALEMAIRHSPSGRMLFYAHPLDEALRGDGRGALLDIHPVIGWPD